MTQDNFMYEWRKAKEHYDTLADGSIQIHHDAPQHVKESYKEYDRIMNKVVNFSKKRTSLLDVFAHKNDEKEMPQHKENSIDVKKVYDDVQVKAILDNDSKKVIATKVLDDLVDWFGIESAKQEYIEESANMPFWACYKEGEAVGFLALKKHNQQSAEVYVMGVLAAFHHQHFGHSLMQTCERWCIDNKIEYLQVKTVDASSEDEYYAKTRAFYMASGFAPLEVFPTLWDEHNPCLLMVKKMHD